MTPAEVIKVMGFEGERFETVSSSFSVSSRIYFRESARRHIVVYFNRNQRAYFKELYGIQVITLEKYQAIKTGAAEGSTRAELWGLKVLTRVEMSRPTRNRTDGRNPPIRSLRWTS